MSTSRTSPPPEPWEPHLRLLTIDEAAASIGRPASTVRRWISDGRLHPIAAMGWRRLYLEEDVLAVEAATHRSKRRRT